MECEVECCEFSCVLDGGCLFRVWCDLLCACVHVLMMSELLCCMIGWMGQGVVILFVVWKCLHGV